MTWLVSINDNLLLEACEYAYQLRSEESNAKDGTSGKLTGQAILSPQNVPFRWFLSTTSMCRWGIIPAFLWCYAGFTVNSYTRSTRTKSACTQVISYPRSTCTQVQVSVSFQQEYPPVSVLRQQKTELWPRGLCPEGGWPPSPAYNVEPVTNTSSSPCANNGDGCRRVCSARRRPSRLYC